MGPELDSHDDRHLRLRTVAVMALCAALVVGVFFVDFLVVPLGVLILFYIGFAAADRSKRNGGGGQLSA